MQQLAVSFAARPVIQTVRLASGECVFVVDDVLDSPREVIALAEYHAQDFALTEANAFPGPQLLMPNDFSVKLDNFFRLHIRSRLQLRRSITMHSRLSRVERAPQDLDARQRICHRDNAGLHPTLAKAASVLYLFDNPALGGTAFFEPAGQQSEAEQLVEDASSLSGADFGGRYDWPPSYMTEGNQHFKLLGRVAAKFNRIIFYDGGIFHSGDIAQPHLLNDPKGLGRLTVNGFFTCTRNAK